MQDYEYLECKSFSVWCTSNAWGEHLFNGQSLLQLKVFNALNIETLLMTIILAMHLHTFKEYDRVSLPPPGFRRSSRGRIVACFSKSLCFINLLRTDMAIPWLLLLWRYLSMTNIILQLNIMTFGKQHMWIFWRNTIFI